MREGVCPVPYKKVWRTPLRKSRGLSPLRVTLRNSEFNSRRSLIGESPAKLSKTRKTVTKETEGAAKMKGKEPGNPGKQAAIFLNTSQKQQKRALSELGKASWIELQRSGKLISHKKKHKSTEIKYHTNLLNKKRLRRITSLPKIKALKNTYSEKQSISQ